MSYNVIAWLTRLNIAEPDLLHTYSIGLNNSSLLSSVVDDSKGRLQKKGISISFMGWGQWVHFITFFSLSRNDFQAIPDHKLCIVPLQGYLKPHEVSMNVWWGHATWCGQHCCIEQPTGLLPVHSQQILKIFRSVFSFSGPKNIFFKLCSKYGLVSPKKVEKYFYHFLRWWSDPKSLSFEAFH